MMALPADPGTRARIIRRDLLALQSAPPVGTCTAETTRCPTARLYDHRLPACCRGHVRQLVADTVAALDEVGIAWWADYGTLLGAVRNPLTTWADYPWLGMEGHSGEPLAPGIIPHDKDADLGAVWNRRKILAVQSILEERGYHVRFRALGQSLKIRLSNRNHTNVDLFTWLERPDGTFYRTTYCAVDAYKGREISRAMLLPQSTVEWEGMTLRAPADPAAFCAFRYGPTWQTPVMANHAGVRR